MAFLRGYSLIKFNKRSHAGDAICPTFSTNQGKPPYDSMPVQPYLYCLKELEICEFLRFFPNPKPLKTQTTNNTPIVLSNYSHMAIHAFSCESLLVWKKVKNLTFFEFFSMIASRGKNVMFLESW